MPHEALSGGLAGSFARFLSRSYEGLSAGEALDIAIRDDFPGQIAVVSSFGAEAAVLLALVAEVAPETPVLMVDTGKLFAETLAYQSELAASLGLTDVRTVGALPTALAAGDPDGTLHARDPEACCALRKVAPYQAAIAAFDVIITGRKRYQAGTRETLGLFEADGPARLRFNPLANWSPAEIRTFMADRALPLHPLVAKGYRSIGCAPCTTPVEDGEDDRAGRWRGSDKTECGIHFRDGRPMRQTG